MSEIGKIFLVSNFIVCIIIVLIDFFVICFVLDIVFIGVYYVGYNLIEVELVYVCKVYDNCFVFMIICGGIEVFLRVGILEGKIVMGLRFMLDILR